MDIREIVARGLYRLIPYKDGNGVPIPFDESDTAEAYRLADTYIGIIRPAIEAELLASGWIKFDIRPSAQRREDGER